MVATSLFFFYYFFKAFIPRRTALTTVVLLGASHYLLSFSKIGYNTLQGLFALGLILATFVWALKTMNFTTFSLLGLSIGICFYIYPAALYIIPLPFLGLLIFLPPMNKDALKRWGWTIVSLALLVYPLISQPKYWSTKVAGTFLYTDVSNSVGTLIKNISLNMLYTSLSFLYIPEARFSQWKVTEKRVLEHFKVTKSTINEEVLGDMLGLLNALSDGEVLVEDIFPEQKQEQTTTVVEAIRQNFKAEPQLMTDDELAEAYKLEIKKYEDMRDAVALAEWGGKVALAMKKLPQDKLREVRKAYRDAMKVIGA